MSEPEEIVPIVIEDTPEMKVKPSRKRRKKKTEEETIDPLSDEGKNRPFITVAKKRRATKDEYYVDREEFTAALKEYYETEDDTGENYEKLGKFFIKIATGLASASSFARYSWRSDFIGEALIKMTKALRGKKFSFEFGSHPFSYFTQVAYWAFIAVIKAEKKQSAIAKKYREIKYIESFKDCEDTKNVYIRPEGDGEIFHDSVWEDHEN